MWRGIVFGLISMAAAAAVVAAAPAQADEKSCKEFRDSLLAMESTSVRPPGWDSVTDRMRFIYMKQCMLHPLRTADTEYWYRIDGTPTGASAGASAGDSAGDRPADGAYAATVEIGAFCARAGNPSMCALAKSLEAACLKPIDDQERRACPDILAGRVPTLPREGEDLPLHVLAQRPAAAQISNAAIWADPGFQRMCGQANTNMNTCARRQQNMSNVGTLGNTGQAGAFKECKELYGRVLDMCQGTKQAAMAQPRPATAVAVPKAAPAPAAPPAAVPGPQPMSADCAQAVSNYVGAAQANDGPRAMAGYNALKAKGGCGVLGLVDRAPAPAASGGDDRLLSRGARPHTADAIGTCDQATDGCAEAMRQLERASSPAAQAAMIGNAIQVGLELGAAMANGLAATLPQGGGRVGSGGSAGSVGGGTDYRSIGNAKVRSTYGEGSPGIKCGPRGC